MLHTFTHFGPRINLVSTRGRDEIVDTLSISDAVALRDALDAAIVAAEAAAIAEAEDTRERYSLELGVNDNGERVCAVEAGPFETSADAVSFAMDVRGRAASAVETLPNVQWYDLGPDSDAAHCRIVGATLNIFTNRGGTVRDVDLY